MALADFCCLSDQRKFHFDPFSTKALDGKANVAIIPKKKQYIILTLWAFGGLPSELDIYKADHYHFGSPLTITMIW